MTTKIFTIAGGFYYFGTQVDAPEGYLALKDFAMFGNYAGEHGLPGVARGEPKATVTLDRFTPGEIGYFPISSCYGILPSIDLYKFKGTKLR